MFSEEVTTTNSTSKVLGVLSYLLSFVTWVIGPIVMYFIFRSRDKFVAFHALYNVYLISIGTVLYFILGIVFAAIAYSLNMPNIIQLLVAIFLGLPLLLLMLYGFIACLIGKTPLFFAGMINKQISRYYKG
jgi:uncharacterized membrane protein